MTSMIDIGKVMAPGAAADMLDVKFPVFSVSNNTEKLKAEHSPRIKYRWQLAIVIVNGVLNHLRNTICSMRLGRKCKTPHLGKKSCRQKFIPILFA
jgi:hypothetical protein